MKATVGRIVHFYDERLRGLAVHPEHGINLNGQSNGPYPALVLQTNGEGRYINLRVDAFGGEWTEGSVSVRKDTPTTSDGRPTKYWEWPPREEDGDAKAAKK